MKVSDEKDYVTCGCGWILTKKDTAWSNGCNEEGEDFHEGVVICDKCGTIKEVSDWGECESDSMFFSLFVSKIEDKEI